MVSEKQNIISNQIVLDVQWFGCQGSMTIGIVTCVDKMENGKTKVYMGIGGGFDEKVDIKNIIEMGAKFHPNRVFKIANSFKDVEQYKVTDDKMMKMLMETYFQGVTDKSNNSIQGGEIVAHETIKKELNATREYDKR